MNKLEIHYRVHKGVAYRVSANNGDGYVIEVLIITVGEAGYTVPFHEHWHRLGRNKDATPEALETAERLAEEFIDSGFRVDKC